MTLINAKAYYEDTAVTELFTAKANAKGVSEIIEKMLRPAETDLKAVKEKAANVKAAKTALKNANDIADKKIADFESAKVSLAIATAKSPKV